MEGLRFCSSFQDAVGFDEEAIEFEWTNFPEFSTLSIFQEIQRDLEKGKIIFMSMLNDIEWKTNDENCISNAEKQELLNEILARTLGIPASRVGREVVWRSSCHAQKGQWNCTADKMVQRFKATGHLILKGISALSREILKQKKGKTSIHFNGDSMNKELLFQTLHSVNRLCVSGAVASWCYQFGSTEEEKGRTCTLVDNK